MQNNLNIMQTTNKNKQRNLKSAFKPNTQTQKYLQKILIY